MSTITSQKLTGDTKKLREIMDIGLESRLEKGASRRRLPPPKLAGLSELLVPTGSRAEASDGSLVTQINWGLSTPPANAIAVASDYDGDGKADIGSFVRQRAIGTSSTPPPIQSDSSISAALPTSLFRIHTCRSNAGR